MTSTSRIYILGVALSLLFFVACTRPESPQPLLYSDKPQDISLYKVGAADTLVYRISLNYLANGSIDFQDLEANPHLSGSIHHVRYASRYVYNNTGKLATQEFYLKSSGSGPDLLTSRRTVHYTNAGLVKGIDMGPVNEPLTPIVHRIYFSERYENQSDGSIHRLAKDSSATFRIYNRNTYKHILNRSGQDSVSLLQDTSVAPNAWRPYMTMGYDQLGRLISKTYTGTTSANDEVYTGYIACKIPAVLRQYAFAPVFSPLNSSYYPQFYPFSDANYVASSVLRRGIAQYELDNTAGAAVELNPAGYLKTLRFTKLDTVVSTVSRQRYKLVLNY